MENPITAPCHAMRSSPRLRSRRAPLGRGSLCAPPVPLRSAPPAAPPPPPAPQLPARGRGGHKKPHIGAGAPPGPAPAAGPIHKPRRGRGLAGPARQSPAPARRAPRPPANPAVRRGRGPRRGGEVAPNFFPSPPGQGGPGAAGRGGMRWDRMGSAGLGRDRMGRDGLGWDGGSRPGAPRPSSLLPAAGHSRAGGLAQGGPSELKLTGCFLSRL